MAAVVCGSISNVLSGACRGCNKLLCNLPCTILSSACKLTCDVINQIFSTPFCIYTAFAIGMNAPQLFYGFASLPYVGGCKGSQWLSVNILFSIAHITASLYLAVQAKSFSEARETLCYDTWIAAYIVVGIVSLIWLWTGQGWLDSGAMNDGGQCPDNIAKLTSDTITYSHSFFGLGLTALFISVMVAMCCFRGNNRNDHHQEDDNFRDEHYQSKYYFVGKYSAFNDDKA